MLLLLCNGVIADSIINFFFFQAEDGIRYLVRSRGLGDVYKRQVTVYVPAHKPLIAPVGLMIPGAEMV